MNNRPILLVEDNPSDIQLTQRAFAVSKIANKLIVVEGIRLTILNKERIFGDSTLSYAWVTSAVPVRPPAVACTVFANRPGRFAAVNIPAEVCARFETAAKLNDEDRTMVVELARTSLAR